MTLATAQDKAGDVFTLPELPFAKNALEPHMSAETFDYHHGKHHNAYVVKANELIQGTGLEDLPLEEIVRQAKAKGLGPLFNNVGQHFNHSFFWQCMKPQGGGEPTGALLEKINASFGSFDKFKEDFVNGGIGQFGSGWVWLVENGGKLEIVKTANAETPLTEGKKPLLVCDVWEHAYYIDFQNRRPDFLKSFLENLVNWDFVASNL
ncbi:MAG: superoxide dismutase [Pseudomonadota bacterium]|nr:superoxide dismutase [Pseudomonadota bacterium]QKK05868.1 MAG: superoxide dismutase [Pseudomonadota bacterium]